MENFFFFFDSFWDEGMKFGEFYWSERGEVCLDITQRPLVSRTVGKRVTRRRWLRPPPSNRVLLLLTPLNLDLDNFRIFAREGNEWIKISGIVEICILAGLANCSSELNVERNYYPFKSLLYKKFVSLLIFNLPRK